MFDNNYPTQKSIESNITRKNVTHSVYVSLVFCVKETLIIIVFQQAARKNNAAAGGFWSGSWWPSLYSSFSTTIVENLQV